MSAAGVHRLPPRRTGVRLWGMRLLGLLGTAAVLGVGVAAVLTVLPDRGHDAAVVSAAPSTVVAPAHRKRRHVHRLTAAQRRARTAAVATLRAAGYRPVKLSDYAPTHVLRVLVGRGESGERAFFFAGGKFLGNDAADDSEQISVGRSGERSVTLSYRLYGEGPKRSQVRFRWDGKLLAAQTAIPPVTLRHPPAP